MKELFKISIIFIFLFLISGHGYSQKFGVKFGANSSFMHVKNDDGRKGTEPITNFIGGLTIGPKLDTTMTWAVDLYYSPKGYDIYGHRLYINYIDLDAKLKVSLGKSPLFIPLGAYIGYGLNGEYKNKFYGNSDIEFGNGEDDYTRIDFGFLLGLGVKHKYFQASVQYKHGVIDINHLNYSSVTNGLINLAVDFYIN